MTILSCNRVCISYRDEMAVDHVSFNVQKGDYLAIVGENGSGKSSLMKALLGLKEPLCGEVSYAHVAPGGIGYLPQSTMVSKDFPASVEEVVRSGALGQMGGKFFYSAREKKWAKDAMAKLSIEELKHKSFRELSGGQRQRTLLARAICGPKEILMLDEPAAGLDPHITEEFYQLVAKLNKQGLTIVHISHDLRRVLQDANRVLELKSHLVYFGDVRGFIETRKKVHEEEDFELTRHL